MIKNLSGCVRMSVVPRVWPLLLLSLSAAIGARAQFALTKSGAMAVLNNSLSPTLPTNPVTMARIPASDSALSTPGNISTGTIGSPNDRAVWFTYRAPLTWYSAFFDYKTAASGVAISKGVFGNIDPQEQQKADAVAFLTDDRNFTPFPLFKTETLVMAIRSNNPLAVQLSTTSPQDLSSTGIAQYRPTRGDFYVEIPLDFTKMPASTIR